MENNEKETIEINKFINEPKNYFAMSESVRNEEGMNENMNAAIEFVDDARFASIAVMFPEKEISLVSDKSGILYASISIEGKTFRHKLLTSKNVNVNNLSGLDFAALAALYPDSEVRIEKDEENNSIYVTFSVDGKDFDHTLVKYNGKDGVSKSTLLLLDKSFPNSNVTLNEESVSISIAGRTFRYKLKCDEIAKVVDSEVDTAMVKVLNESDFAALANCFDDAEITLKKLTFSEFKKLTGESAAALGEDPSSAAKPKNNDQYLFASILVNDVEFLCKLMTYKKINDGDLSDAQFALIANLNREQEVTLKTDKGQISKCITVAGRNFRKVLVNYGKVTKGLAIVNDNNFQWLKDNFADRSTQLTDTKDGIYDTITIDGKVLGRKILSLKPSGDPIAEIQVGASIIRLPYKNGCTAVLAAISGRTMCYCIYACNKSEKKKASDLTIAFAKREAAKIMANTITMPEPKVEDNIPDFNEDVDEEELNEND